MFKHGFCADRPHRIFWLKSASATGKLYALSLPVSSCNTSEILAIVELFSCALLADNCLVARYESCKESSVSVCHNSNFDLVNNRSRTRYVPRRFWLLVTARNTMRTAMNLAIHQSVKAAPYTSLCDYIPLSLYSVSVDYFYCFHNYNMFWLIAGSTLSYCPILAYWSCDHFHRRST